MAAIQFPNSPSSGDNFTASNGISYTYDGEKWNVTGASNGIWNRTGTTVSLANAGDDLNIDSNTLFVDASTNKVGIGTGTPSATGAALQVVGGVTSNAFYGESSSNGATVFSGVYLDGITDPVNVNIRNDGFATFVGDLTIGDKIIHHSDTNTAIRFPAVDTVTVETAGSERLRIDSSGNLGLGVTSPVSKLHVKGDSGTGTGIFIHNANGATNSSADLYFGNWSGSTTTAPQARIQALNKNVNTAATDLKFYIYDGTNTVERLKITSSGDVEFPSTSASAQQQILFSDGTSGRGKIVYRHDGDSLAFETLSSERMRIDSSGRLLVGTTTASSFSNRPMSIGDASDSNGSYLEIRNGAQSGVVFSDGTASNTSGYMGSIEYDHTTDNLFFRTGAVERLRIDSSGDILARTIDARIGSNVGGVEYGTSTNNSVRFYQNNTERMRIEDHRVAIGATSPTHMLHVAGTTRSGTTSLNDYSYVAYSNSTAYGGYYSQNNGSGYVFTGHNGSSTTSHIKADGTIYAANLTDGTTTKTMTQIMNAAAGSATTSLTDVLNNNNSSALTMRLTNTGAGTLLVGTSTASSHSNRPMTIGDTSMGSNYLEIRGSTSAGVGVVFSDGTSSGDDSGYRGSIEYAHSSDYLFFRAAGTEQLRLTSAGNLGVGTTSPSYKIDAYRSGSGIVSRFGKETIYGEFNVTGDAVSFQGTRSSDSAVTGFFIHNPGNTGTSNFDHVSVQTAGSERFRINAAGKTLIGTTTYPNASGSGYALYSNLVVMGYSGGSSGAGSITIAAGSPSTSHGDGTDIGTLVWSDNAGKEYARIMAEGDVANGTSTSSPGQLTFWTTSNGATMPTQRMALTANGDLGIGIANPSTRLHVSGGISTFDGDCTFAAAKVSAVTSSGHGRLRVFNSSGTETANIYGGDGFGTFEGIQLPGNGQRIYGNNSTGSNNSYIEMYNGTTGDMTFAVTYSTADFVWKTSGTEKMRLLSNGDLGIGTSSPGQKLHVSGTGETNVHFAGTASTVGGYLYLQNLNATDNNSYVIEGADAQGQGTSQIQFYNVSHTNNEGAIAFNTRPSGGSMAERLRIDSTGRAMIGTTVPLSNATLNVQGTTDIGSVGRIALKRSTTSPSGSGALGIVHFSDSGTVSAAEIRGRRNAGTWTSGSSQPSMLTFHTTADGAATVTERMRIFSSGITSVFTNDVNGAINACTSESAGTSANLFTGKHTATDTQNGTTSFAVYSNGNVVNTNNSYGSLSDINLKENIRDITSQWDDVKAVRLVKFEFKDKEAHGEGDRIGVIAQELEEISPTLVTNNLYTQTESIPVLDDDGNPVLDEDGNELTEVNSEEITHKSVKYSVLTLKFMGALQEAMDRIEELETKIAALENA